jgi:hypothetical protein
VDTFGDVAKRGLNPGRTSRSETDGKEEERRDFEGKRRHERINPIRKFRGTVESSKSRWAWKQVFVRRGE